MVQGKWYPMGADIAVPIAIRQAVFGRGRDELDNQAQQVVVFDGDTPVGSARLWWRDGAFWLGDVGVLPSMRRRGFGDLLVRLLLFKALSHSAREIRLTADRDAADFFARYGFEPDGPDMHLKAEHVKLSHCGGCKGRR